MTTVDKRWKCGACGHLNRKDRVDCVICSWEHLSAQAEEKHGHCEECHARVPVGRAFCDICAPHKTQM